MYNRISAMVANSFIILGTDANLLKSLCIDTTTDPSGFSQHGFNIQLTEKILALAQNAWETIEQSLPKNTSIPLPKSISLYMENVSEQQENPAAAMICRSDRSLAQIHKQKTDIHWVIDVVNYPIPEIRGIALSLSPEMLSKQADCLYEILVHEMFHVLSHQALASSIAFTEAFAEHLTQSILSKRLSKELMHLEWKPEAFASTCGLRIDDFAEYGRTTDFRDLLRIHVLNSFMDLSYDEVWTIISMLFDKAKNSGFCPRSIDILKAIQYVVGSDRIESVLQSMLIRPLREGKQFFFCPFGEEAFAFCFDVRKNNNYLHAVLEEPLAWDKYQFTIEKSVTDLAVIADLKNGRKISMNVPLNGEWQLSYKTLVALLKSSTECSDEITVIHCEALGIVATLQKSP